jgi:hypothetical protein
MPTPSEPSEIYEIKALLDEIEVLLEGWHQKAKSREGIALGSPGDIAERDLSIALTARIRIINTALRIGLRIGCNAVALRATVKLLEGALPVPEIGKKRIRGRPKGARASVDLDAKLLEEMDELMCSETALTRTGAARQVVPKAVGGGTEDAKIHRLYRKHKEKSKAKGDN